MDDDDAVLVASQWWQSQRSTRVCITGIVAQIDGLGIPRPKKNCTLRELLIHFGNSSIFLKSGWIVQRGCNCFEFLINKVHSLSSLFLVN